MAVLLAITVSSTLAECPGGRVLFPPALTLDLAMELVLANGPYAVFEQNLSLQLCGWALLPVSLCPLL